MPENENKDSPIKFRVEEPIIKVDEPTVKVVATEVKAEPVVEVSPVETKEDPIPQVPVEEVKPTIDPPKPAEPVTQTPIADALNKMEPPKSNSSMVIVLLMTAALGLGWLTYSGTFQPYVDQVKEYVTKKVIHDEVKDFTQKTKEKVKQKIKEVRDDLPKSPRIEEARDYYLRIDNGDQSITVRTGGSLSWRLNNPCSVLYGPYATKQGAMGKASKYAVWMKYEDGRKACYDLLFESNHGYKERSVADAIRRYAPLKEGFKTQKYLDAIKKARINDGHKMTDLSEANRQKLIDVLMDVEDYSPGKVTVYPSRLDFERRGY